ncbi:MAG TPA: thioredoxin domain-containing protein [Solirubrobacteraceae bacterium]|nr:thioredoxin domain-containing protein [Solirubrobacteraceae bacterium]
MANALSDETSPYLLQHKDNPVNWRPWGPEALAEARERDVPLLVSIGYSACHWCHVMERESFEDPEVAAYMNERFVPVKVDREERPDVDAIYMDAVQAMTGRGGWPLNAFATPEQVPFFAGTYFPPDSRGGMPSWRMVLEAVAKAWDDRRDEIRAGGERIVERLRGGALLKPSRQPIHPGAVDAALDGLRAAYDPVNGGFGGAPKFPPASPIELLLARGETEMSLGTLRAMAAGGIYDQVGGGFSRYAVDATWTVPHFEKMLYDNALLARAYLHGFLVSGDAALRRVVEETLDWALREMRGPEGGFLSALDADSEGVEGKYYVWTVDELREVLGDRADDAIAWFGATERGNFEPHGANVLEARGPRPDDADFIREALYAAREERVRPGLDDKRLTAWNALMVAALADAGAALERPDYVAAAVRAAEFLVGELRDGRGRLLRTWKDGRARLDGYLEDHAYTLEALLTLYEATFDPRWFGAARELADVMVQAFGDPEHGGFFTTASDHEELAARRKDLEDTPAPSGSSAAAYGLLRLAALTGEHEYERQAVGVLRLVHELAPQHPQAFAHLLQALAFHTSPVREVALVGEHREALERAVRTAHRPYVVLAGTSGDAGGVPLLEGRTPVDGRAAAYVCERFACQRPVTDAEELVALLG